MSIIGLVKSATNEDFVALKGKIQGYINADVHRRIPLLVRNVFHDLFLQDKAGLHGCIVESGGAGPGNEGLSQVNADLKQLIQNDFKDKGFTFGDVAAFASKVALETAYPCINIPFKFNRGKCTQTALNTGNAPTDPDIDTIAGLKGSLDYLGLSPREIAILQIGAHAIKGARGDKSGWKGVFSDEPTSGKAYIKRTFESSWTAISGPLTRFQFFTGGNFNPTSSIIRLASELIFFSDVVPNGSTKDTSAEANAIQEELRGFTTKSRDAFDQEFAKVFEKMLMIGGGDQSFTETIVKGICTEAGVSTSSIVPPKTSSTSVPSSSVPPKTTSVSSSSKTISATESTKKTDKTSDVIKTSSTQATDITTPDSVSQTESATPSSESSTNIDESDHVDAGSALVSTTIVHLLLPLFFIWF